VYPKSKSTGTSKTLSKGKQANTMVFL